jgi:hypothetical protein
MYIADRSHNNLNKKNLKKNKINSVKTLTTVKMSLVVLWVVMLCGLAGRYQTPTFQKNLMPQNSEEKFIDQLSFYQILKKYSAPWSKLNPSSVCIKY